MKKRRIKRRKSKGFARIARARKGLETPAPVNAPIKLDYEIPVEYKPAEAITHDEARQERLRRLKRTFISSILLRPLAFFTPIIVTPIFYSYLGGKLGYGLYESTISFSMFIMMANAGLTLGVSTSSPTAKSPAIRRRRSAMSRHSFLLCWELHLLDQ